MWNPLELNHHHAMFGGYWSNQSGDVTCLICDVTSQNLVIQRSSDFMSVSSSLCVTSLPIPVAIGIAVVEICF